MFPPSQGERKPFAASSFKKANDFGKYRNILLFFFWTVPSAASVWLRFPRVDVTTFHFQPRSSSQPISCGPGGAEFRAGGDSRTERAHRQKHCWLIKEWNAPPHPPAGRGKLHGSTFKIKHLHAASGDCAASNMNDM